MPPSASAVAAVPPRPIAIPPSPAQNGSSTMPMRAPVTQTSSGDNTELSGLRTEFLGYLSGAAKCIKDQSELSNQQSKDMGNLMKAVGAMNLKQEQFERNQQELLNNQQNDRKNQDQFQAQQRQTNEDRIFFEDQQRQTNENRIVFEDQQRQTNENNSQEISELKSSNAALRSANDDLSSRVRSLELQQASTPSQRTSAASPFGANGSTQATPQVNASAQGKHIMFFHHLQRFSYNLLTHIHTYHLQHQHHFRQHLNHLVDRLRHNQHHPLHLAWDCSLLPHHLPPNLPDHCLHHHHLQMCNPHQSQVDLVLLPPRLHQSQP